MADFRIVIQMDTSQVSKGAATIKTELNSLGTAVDRVRNLIKGAFVFAGIGFGIKAITDLADAYTQSQNRIRTVTKDSAELTVVMQELFKISSDTGVKFEVVAETYTRTASAAQNLGRSQQELLDFTKRLNEAVVLSGANSNETAGALIQLSQGIGSAALRGQELRSVLTQLPAVADIIVKEFNRMNQGANYTRASLRDLGKEGKITPQIILDAFKHAGDEIDKNFAHAIPTIQRSVQTLRTNVIEMLGDFNKNTGAQGAFARAILVVADNVDILGRAFLVLAIIVGEVYAKKAVTLAINATKELFALMLKNPIFALAAAINIAVVALIAFGDQVQIGGGYFGNLQDLALTAFQFIKAGIAEVVDFFKENFPGIFTLGQQVFGGLNLSVAGFIEFVSASIGGFVGIFSGAFSVIAGLVERFGAATRVIFGEILDGLKGLVEGALNKIIDGINLVTAKFKGISAIDPIKFAKNQVSDSDLALLNGSNVSKDFQTGAALASPIADFGTKFLQQVSDNAKARIEEEKKQAAILEAAKAGLGTPGTALPSTLAAEKLGTFDNIISKLKAENAALLLNKDAREIADKEAEIAYRLKQKELSGAQIAILEPLLKENQLRQEQAEILDRLRGPVQDLAKGQAALNDLMAQGLITTEEYNNELRKLQIASLEAGRDLETGLQKGLLTISEQFGNVANLASETLVGSFGKAEDALVSFFSTGKLGFKDLVASIEADITKLAVRQSITGPLANFLGLQGGQGGGFGSIFGSLFSSGSSGSGGSFLSSLGSLFGFAEGGGFTVGGTGGVDSQLVGFKATPGETVTVKTPKQQREGSRNGMNVTFNISTPDANSFQRSQPQILATTQAQLARANKRNN